MEINQIGFYSEIVLIVRSLGNVYRFSSGLVHLGIPKCETNFLAKYCSISAILGSETLWKLRCRDVKRTMQPTV